MTKSQHVVQSLAQGTCLEMFVERMSNWCHRQTHGDLEADKIVWQTEKGLWQKHRTMLLETLRKKLWGKEDSNVERIMTWKSKEDGSRRGIGQPYQTPQESMGKPIKSMR